MLLLVWQARKERVTERGDGKGVGETARQMDRKTKRDRGEEEWFGRE